MKEESKSFDARNAPKSIKERELELQLTVLQKQIDQLNALDGLCDDQDIEENQPLKKGKGRGKTSQPQQLQSPQAAASFLERLRSLRQPRTTEELQPEDQQSTSAQSSSFSNRTPPPGYEEDPDPPPAPPEPKTKTIYIRKVELLLNGSPIDQVNILV